MTVRFPQHHLLRRHLETFFSKACFIVLFEGLFTRILFYFISSNHVSYFLFLVLVHVCVCVCSVSLCVCACVCQCVYVCVDIWHYHIQVLEITNTVHLRLCSYNFFKYVWEFCQQPKTSIGNCNSLRMKMCNIYLYYPVFYIPLDSRGKAQLKDSGP